jgi:DNA recombination-dependent growth factor C
MMGLIYGSGSFARFLVGDPLPDNFLEELPMMISRYAFQNLDEHSDQERSAGWVNILDMFDSEFVTREYLMEPCMAMSWRVDVRKVPPSAIEQYCRDAEQRIKRDEGLDHLPKGRRQEIRAAVRTSLLKRAIPRSNIYDMIWNLRNGIVLFGSTSLGLCDEFAEFFFNCFGLHLKPLFPYAIALQILEAEGMEGDILDGLRPSAFGEVD